MRKQWLIILLTFLVAGTVLAGETISNTVLHSGMDRTYDVYVPDSYDGETPAPLLIALHPSGADGEMMASISGLNELADEKGFIIAYPEGPYGYWDYGAGLPEWADVEGVLDDPGYVVGLVNVMKGEYAIDPLRVYVLGYSNGGRMAYRSGCDLAGTVAAIGVVAATISSEVVKTCEPGKHISVVYLQGTDDQVIPWEGKPLYMPDGMYIADALSAVDTFQFWAAQNDCESEPEFSQLDANPGDARSVQRGVYIDCADETSVAFYAFTGAGHSWTLDENVNTAALIWDFFEQNSLLEAPEQ